MLIDETMKIIGQQGNNSFYYFENLVIKLLTKYLEDQEKPFRAELRSGPSHIDGLAIEGIDDLPGPTLIEIKYGRIITKLTLHKLFSICKRENYSSILLIIGGNYSAKQKKLAMEIAETLDDDIVFRVWNLNDLSDILDKYPEYVPNINPSLTKLAIKNVVSKSQEIDPIEWKNIRDRHVEQLKKAYTNNDLILFLGAGVSSKAGMPDWNSLISKLMVTMIKRQFSKSLDVTKEEMQLIADEFPKLHGQSPLLEARYIRAGFGKSFGQEISKILYEGIGKEGLGTSILINAIARLCVPKRSGPGIRAVVNYNFDDLIENHLEEVNVEYHPIFRDIDIATQNELGIYHVHGFLPRNIKTYEGVSESLLVFSEEGYHTLFIDPYSWSNIIQLNFLRESICLMVGLSITDPNLRRLLDIAARKNNQIRHYVIFKRLLASEFFENIGEKKAIKTEVIEAFLIAHHKLQEASFQELGLNIIWIEDFDEIPDILNSIKN
ncbi:MAG: SIR2 family protein [Methanosarcinales archaeon]|nr:SIR2 family protein [Methanosarcinales archaeon]